MLSIKSVLMPFRLSLSKKAPISLRLELANTDEETKLLTLKLLVEKDLSVDKGGIASALERKIGDLKPGESKLMYFDIFPKISARKEDYKARLIIYEHYNTYEFVNKEYKKDFIVKVVD